MDKINPAYLRLLVVGLFIIFFGLNTTNAQSFSAPTGLSGENVVNPTSLEFGPNGNLYVAQQDGTIWEFVVERDGAAPGSGSYSATSSTAIDIVKTGVPNHNDDGTTNTANTRQVTGLLTAGTAVNPILYVSSSDSRIGGGGSGGDENLDTNSGVLSRLTWNGSSWVKVDLVRGLPRCEENHSTNGMDMFQLGGNTYLLLQQGGNTNKGAPSNNFAGTQDTFLSGALLIINLTQLEGMTTYTDPRNGAQYVYDLPTLNDPERTDIDNTDPNFPYPAGHPKFNATIDLGDPFGGNNGLNQAFPETGGPVQIFSPGYRNAYDVVITPSGQIYTVDNGGNTDWGGLPVIYTSADVRKGDESTTTYDPGAGDYITNEFNESGSDKVGDALHYVGTINDPNGTYYGGHPVPIRAFPSRAGVVKYVLDNGSWILESTHDWADLLVGTSGYFNASFTIADFPDDSDQGFFLTADIGDPRVNIFDVVDPSTNGITQYTASNFSGAMQGDLLTASFSNTGQINRYELNGAGDGITAQNNAFLTAGNQALDVIAQGDADIFPGTIWVATYGTNSITIFEPADFGTCLQPSDPGYDPLEDSDNDGYTNGDEVDNGTDHCNGGSVPNDNDNDLISDLNDPDDDNDGINDIDDVFAIDPDNGTTTNLPLNYPFWNNDPGTGFAGLGFTGWMINNATDYLDQYDPTNLSFGGAGGKATVDAVTDGDALGNSNDQDNGFQFGINVDSNSPAFTVYSEVENPFGTQEAANGQSQGIYIGNGDQDNYLKIVITNGSTFGDGIDGFEVVVENAGTPTSNSFDVANLVSANAVNLYIAVDPSSNMAQPYYSLDGGDTVIALGSAITLPTSFLDPNDTTGMAVGLIATSSTPGNEFSATWDYINILNDGPANLAIDPNPVDFGTLSINSGTAQLNVNALNTGSPAAGSFNITSINITGPDAALFSHNTTLPLLLGPGSAETLQINFTPDTNPGVKTADLVFTHTGVNTPLTVPLNATLIDGPVVLYRVNSGGPEITAIDGGLDWLEDTPANNVQYLTEAGSNDAFGFGMINYTPEVDLLTTPTSIFDTERGDITEGAPNMTYSFPVAQPGNYEIRLYIGNGWPGTANEGERIFDATIEGIVYPMLDDIDLSGTYGHQVGAVLSHIVNVTDGTIDISFVHGSIENPIVNGIEILDVSDFDTPIYVAEIPTQTNFNGEVLDGSLAVNAIGGDGNLSYIMSGQPQGVTIEPTNGQIGGTIASNASDSSPYNVTITVDDSDGLSSDAVVINFVWNIEDPFNFRINAAGNEVVATDDGSDWAFNNVNGSFTTGLYSVNVGFSIDAFLTYENRDSSIPAYIDQATFDGIFGRERYDVAGGPEMLFTMPIGNGDYVVNLYQGNSFEPASQVGDRIYDISIEGNIVQDNLDLITEFGHLRAGMLSFPVTVSDGELNIEFLHDIAENPIISAIEVFEVNNSNPALTLNSISNQTSDVSDVIDFTVTASGGDPGENITYYISGQPDGVDIEPTNGQISGTIAASAAVGGPNNDGVHTVVVTVTKPGSAPASQVFTWSITQAWVDKDEDESYTARHENSFVQAGDKFYLMGGRENARTIDIYDYASDTWSSIVDTGPFDYEFNHFQATEYKGLIWLIGMFRNNGFPNETPAEFIWAFDPANQEWIQGPQIPAARQRGSAGLAIYNDKFYIVGGNTIGHNGGYVAWLDEYDPATGVWTPLADAPNARDHFAAVVIGTNLYAAGGRLSGGAGGTFGPTIPQVDVYDLVGGTWSTLPAGQNIPTERAGASTVNFNDRLVVIGGETETAGPSLTTTEEYDPVAQSWRTMPSLNSPRHGTQAIVSGNGIFILAGSPVQGGGNQKNMEYFGEDAPVGSPSVASDVDAPAAVQIADGNTEDIDLDISNGNVGVMVTSMVLSGPNAADFDIVAGELTNQLLDPNTTHVISVELTGTGANRSATLTINYGESSSLDILLSNDNTPPNVTNPGDQFNNEGDSVTLPIEATDQSTDLTYAATGLPPNLNIDPVTGIISGTISDGTGPGAFQEVNGLVIIEAESGTLDPTWAQTTTGGATGIIAGSNHFTNQNGGTIPYQIEITTPGVYRFNWRNFYSGTSSTDENDNWLRFPNSSGVWFFGYKGNPANEAALIAEMEGAQNNMVFPVGSGRETPGNPPTGTTPVGSSSNGYFKIYRSGGSPETYNWQASTSDNDPHNIYVRFENAGIYTMEISERSSGHAIDKIALYKVDGQNYSNAELTAAQESPSSGGSGAAANSPYNVTVTVTDDGVPPLDSQVQFVWTIGDGSNEPPVAVPQATPLTGDAPLDVTFTGSNSTDDVGVVTYFWDFKDGTTSTEADPVHTFNTFGTYVVELTVTDGGGLNDTDTITITVNNPVGNEAPVAVAEATPTTGDAPLEVTFTGSNSTDDVGIVTYFWDFMDGNNSNEADPEHTFTVAGDYLVELTVTDGEGLTNTDTIQITVNEQPGNEAPVAVAEATPLTGDAPLEVTFTGSNSTDDVGVVDYLWDFMDGGNVSAEADPTYTFTTAGTYDVVFTVTDAGGLTDTDTITIIVTDPNTNLPPVSIPEATPESGDAPLEVTFTGSNSTDDVGVVSYLWDFMDGGNTSTGGPILSIHLQLREPMM